MVLKKTAPILLLNMDNEVILPKKFRTTSDPFEGPDAGLFELRASGSSQFSEKSLLAILTSISKEHVIVVDLREESHGFVNGMAVSWWTEHNWGNEGKSLEDIKTDEKQRLKEILDQLVTLQKKDFRDPIEAQVERTITEEEFVQSLGIHYIRIPVTDHVRPSDLNIDRFIDSVKNLPKDCWLHFHCSAGKGRTTTFLALYDMMHNAKKIRLEDVLERQRELGGINIASPNVDPTHWKYHYAQERADFLKQFYDYCQQNPRFDISWSAWKIKPRKGD